MKKRILSFIAASLLTQFSFSQQVPWGQSPPNGGLNNTNFWSRVGNANGTNNIMGTRWNSPIYFITGGLTQETYRMRLNGDFNQNSQYAINGYNGFSPTQINTSGYLGLGYNMDGLWSHNTGTSRGPFSVLHLNGRDGTFVQATGYRPWMKTGITLTDNNDLSYIGLRKVGNGNDLTETTIAWADNAGNGFPGPDDMVFRFTSGGGNNNISNNFRSVSDLDGLHIARFTGNGLMALGNTFGIAAGGGNYVRPASLLHLSYDRKGGQVNERYAFMQITYRAQGIPGAGETEKDGLRFGIDNQLYNGAMNSYLRWQENTPFIVQTDWNNSPGGIQNGERMRISSVNAPGVPNSASGAGNITRVSVSHKGNQPVTEPRALLHLGYNTGLSNPFSFEDGWRDWMDIGTFTSNGTDNMYVGLKDEGNDRFDAIINWGDNQTTSQTTNNGPDYLRFVFTSTTTALSGQGDPISQSNDGLEIARMAPNKASTMPQSNYGMLGVGNFASNGPNTGANDVIDAKLDIDGDLRIRTATMDSTLDRVLVIDPNDHNRVHWRNIAPGGLACWDLNGNGIEDPNEDVDGNGIWDALDCQGVIGLTGSQGLIGLTGLVGPQGIQGVVGPQGVPGFSSGAQNGTSMSTIDPTKVAFGNDLGTTDAQLLSNREVPMNGYNIVFTGDGNPIANKIGIGTVNPSAKLDIVQSSNLTGIPIGLRIFQNDLNAKEAINMHTEGSNTNNFGARAFVKNATRNTGYESTISQTGITSIKNIGFAANVNTDTNSIQNFGVNTIVSGGVSNYGIRTHAKGGIGSIINTGIESIATNEGVQNFGALIISKGASVVNKGIHVAVNSGTLTADNYAIWAGVGSGGNTNFAGYFQGAVHVTGPITSTSGTVTTSDQMFKTNIVDLNNSLSLLNQLTPKTFDYDTTNFADFNFEPDNQMGLIAQEVELVIPTIVSNHIRPAQYDSLGIEIAPEIAYKGVEYEELIPLLIGGIQEQQVQITTINNQNDSLEQVVTDLNDRLTQLENCLSGILPFLCELSNSEVQNTDEEIKEKLNEVINIELNDRNNIVLNQNVPNPFAERTIISYSIPANVGKAQIHFYNGMGQLINTVEITERGKGEINVYANDLSTGIYTYSLVADGQIVATKRMMKE